MNENEGPEHELARVPPNSIEAEVCTLGAVLLQAGDGGASVLDRIRTIVRADDFYEPNHRVVFETACRIADRAIDPDAVTIRAYLSKAIPSEELDPLLIGLMEAVPSAARAEEYAKIVRDRADKRRAILALRDLQGSLYRRTASMGEAIEDVVSGVLQVEAESYFEADQDEPFGGSLVQTFEEYEARTDRLAWGLPGLDSITAGTPSGSLNVLGARPGGGKTTLALQIAVAVALEGHRVDICSLEMGRAELAPIMLFGQARIDFEKWTRRRLETHDMKPLHEAADRLYEAPIYIHDPDDMTVEAFRSWANRCAAKGSRLILLDYIQLLTGDESRPRYEQFAKMTRVLKQTARRMAKRGHDCRILALSQLNRDVEKQRGKKRKPRASDLRETGTLEQDADSIILLHPNEKDHGDGRVVDVEAIVEKHRSGRTGIAMYRWDKAERNFVDLLGRMAKPTEEEAEF